MSTNLPTGRPWPGNANRQAKAIGRREVLIGSAGTAALIALPQAAPAAHSRGLPRSSASPPAGQQVFVFGYQPAHVSSGSSAGRVGNGRPGYVDRAGSRRHATRGAPGEIGRR